MIKFKTRNNSKLEFTYDDFLIWDRCLMITCDGVTNEFLKTIHNKALPVLHLQGSN